MPTKRGGYKLKDGTKVPSVTTVCNGLGWSTGALQYWAWDLGRQGFAYKDLLKQAATIGSIVHERIEHDLLGKAWNSSPYDPQDIVASDDPFAKYLEWRKTVEVQVLLSEESLTSERLGYGGTPDFLALLRPAGSDEPWRLTLIDIKTSSGVYASHVAQVAAYAELIETEQRDLVKQHSTSGAIEDFLVLQVGRVDGDFNAKPIPEEMLNLGWALFENLLSIHGLKPSFDKFCEKKKPKNAEGAE